MSAYVNPENYYQGGNKMQKEPTLKYNLDALKAIEIKDVLDHYGLEPVAGNRFRCPNDHKKNKALVSIYSNRNICKCHDCNEFQGDPIKIAMWFNNNDFKAACEDLHEAFRIPFEDETTAPVVRDPQPRRVFEKPQLEYWRFDNQREYTNVDIKKYLPSYSTYTDERKLKLVYTLIYRFSMKRDQAEKYEYYASRKIEPNHYLAQIGWLSPSDITLLCDTLEKYFPLEDLIKFKLYGDASAKRPMQWKYFTKNGFAVVPSFDLYSDMINGLMLRQTQCDATGPKEFQVSCTDISIPLPFAMSPAMLRSNTPVFICEGHIDGLSLSKPFVAFPGVHGYKEEWLGLFQDKKVYIAFDQDSAAKDSIYGTFDENGLCTKEGLRTKLRNAGVKSVEVLHWDESDGSDLNELLKNGNLNEALSEYRL